MDNIRKAVLDISRHSLAQLNYLNHGTHGMAPPLTFLDKKDIEVLIKVLTKHNKEFRKKIRKLKELSDEIDDTGTTIVVCLVCSGSTRVSDADVPKFDRLYPRTDPPETTYCKNCETYTRHWIPRDDE